MGDVMLTREAKARLFDEDFMWLEKQSRTLECGHLMDTVKWVAAEIRAGHDPFEYWKARCEKAERARDELAEGFRRRWQAQPRYIRSAFGDELETFIREFCECNYISRETFDRLIGKGE